MLIDPWIVYEAVMKLAAWLQAIDSESFGFGRSIMPPPSACVFSSSFILDLGVSYS
jgi:hypothetical protein